MPWLLFYNSIYVFLIIIGVLNFFLYIKLKINVYELYNSLKYMVKQYIEMTRDRDDTNIDR